MKSSRSLIATSFFLATLLATTAGCSFGAISYKTETIEQLGVTIDRPTNWGDPKVQSDEKLAEYIIDIPQPKNDKPTVKGRIGIATVKPFSGETVTLKTEADGLKKIFTQRFPDIKIVEESDTQLMGTPAKRLMFEHRNNEDKTIVERVLITLTVKDDKAYSLTLQEDLADFEKYLPVYQKMAETMVQIIPQKQN